MISKHCSLCNGVLIMVINFKFLLLCGYFCRKIKVIILDSVNSRRILNDLKLIKVDLKNIQVTMEEIKTNQNKILESQREKEIEEKIRGDFIMKNSLQLPLCDKVSFDKFNLVLSTNQEFQQDFVSETLNIVHNSIYNVRYNVHRYIFAVIKYIYITVFLII